MIIIEAGNIKCKFNGVTQENLSKRQFINAETLAGIIKQSFVDVYENIDIEVKFMTAEEYVNLKSIFKGTSSIYITDEDNIKRRVVFSNETLSLQKQYVKELDKNIYTGNINFKEN